MSERVTIQSFDWRSLKLVKERRPQLITSALYDDTTAVNNTVWLGGAKIEDYDGVDPTIAAALIAKDIKSDIISPAEKTSDSSSSLSSPQYTPFLTKQLVDFAHDLDMLVKPWTIDTLDVVDEVYGWGVDGVITDWPHQVVRWAELNKLNTAKKYDQGVVDKCLAKHNQLA